MLIFKITFLINVILRLNNRVTGKKKKKHPLAFSSNVALLRTEHSGG